MRQGFDGLTKFIAVAAFVTGASTAVAQSIQSASFQNGIGGYTGTFDKRISSNGTDEDVGSEVANYFLDGSNHGGSPDTQGLIRFDNIFGDGEGQIPPSATILDARITLTSSVRNNAETNGPFGVSALLQEFDEFTTYLDFEPSADSEAEIDRGPWWADGTATRPVAGFGFQVPGGVDSARITPFVQQWADGSLMNHGLAIHAGVFPDTTDTSNTTNGWAYRTTGYLTPASRPKLDVDYTTEPVVVSSFQDTDDSSVTTMAFVRSGSNFIFEDLDEITEDGFDLQQAFLDGVRLEGGAGTANEGTHGSPDDFVLLKFDDVFGGAEGQAPADVPVAKAWAVLTTADPNGDGNPDAFSEGPWTAHTMLREWDTTTLHSTFGDIGGLQEDDGDIGPALDSLEGFVIGSEVWFEVTDYAEGIRTGADDFGIAVQTRQTDDGWMVHANGSDVASARPRLVVYSADLSGGEQIFADCSGDGVVDAADLACVHTTNNPIAARDEVLAVLGSLSWRP